MWMINQRDMMTEHPFDEAIVAAGKEYLRAVRADIAASIEWHRLRAVDVGTPVEAASRSRVAETSKRFKATAAALKKHQDAYRGSAAEWAANWDKLVEGRE